ncbi:C-Maf-inducing protein-like isoform X3 [Tachypleus tridentatus]|uniref:C-Maf-inducing protein-like isoform X3 n=1 Tax=Tachypleus tridentatus TaxID=6853 RepID=UPI003FCF0038
MASSLENSLETHRSSSMALDSSSGPNSDGLNSECDSPLPSSEHPCSSESSASSSIASCASEWPSSSPRTSPSSIPGPSCIIIRNPLHEARSSSSEPSTRQNSVDSISSSEGGYGTEFQGLVSACSSPSRSLPSSPLGPRFKLLHEGEFHVCRLNHTRTVISKILSSKFLRRWENHRLILSDNEIRSKTPTGFMDSPIPYSQIEDVYSLARWDASQKYCIRIIIQNGSLLLQVNNAYVRDQCLNSIQWKRSILKYRMVLVNSTRPDVLLKELKNLIELALTTPLQDEAIYQGPLDIISELIRMSPLELPRSLNEEIVAIITPLLERTTPSPEICDFLCRHCQEKPRSYVVMELFTPVVHRILKHTLDFGKYPKTRIFVQDYIQALNTQNEGLTVVRNFINSIHGPSSTCPHPRVLPNLVSVCLAAVYSLFEELKNFTLAEKNDSNHEMSDWESRHDSFAAIIEAISTFDDWRPGLAQLLQPIPFPDDALAYDRFTKSIKPVIRNISTDPSCDVHLMVLGIRDEKEGWFHLYCPGGIACDDDGDLWSLILKNLLGCCCRRKRFLQGLNKCLGPCMLRALRDDETCQQALCAMLELEVVENKDMQLQIITTLQTTSTGKQQYAALCQRQMHLKELQQKGGPRKLTLPSRSNDADVAKLLSCGSFGNLECLSLAFTQVTSGCAEQLIKLPSLRYLNLWSTQFGDSGLQLISEHLPKLQVLNLCETPVTDKGLVSLAAMKNLRKLNLNSTSLTAQMFEELKKKLPALQECDIRYTDAW